MDENITLKEISILVLGFETALPRAVPITSKAKIPHKVLCWREALYYRTTELARGALDLYNSKRYTSSILLIRGLMETTAFVYWLLRRIRISIETRSVGDIDDFLMRGLLGGREPEASLKAYNVLSAIDHLDKEVSGFRSDYDWLSEFAHPNSFGTHGSYAQVDQEKLTVNFGWYLNNLGGVHALPTFHNSLNLFIDYYDEITDHYEEFKKLCEEDLD